MDTLSNDFHNQTIRVRDARKALRALEAYSWERPLRLRWRVGFAPLSAARMTARAASCEGRSRGGRHALKGLTPREAHRALTAGVCDPLLEALR